MELQYNVILKPLTIEFLFAWYKMNGVVELVLAWVSGHPLKAISLKYGIANQ